MSQGPTPDGVRWWAWAAVVAQVVFVLSWLVAGLWQRPRYDALDHSISDMYAVTAPAGLFLVVVLTVCGAVTIGFALLSVRPVLRGAGWTATVGSWCLALSILGLGDLLSPFEQEACQLADPGCTDADQVATAGGRLDEILSTAGLLLLVAAGFFLAAAMRRVPAWRPRARVATWAAMVLIVLLLATGVLGGVGLSGLAERLLAAFAAAAVGLLAVGVLRRPA